MNDLTLPIADDLHIHLRNDERTPTAIEAVRHGGAGRVLAMPNTAPAITNGRQAADYKADLQAQGADFEILTTIKLTGATTEEDVLDAANHGVAAAKQYPMGVTTNSDDGVTDVRPLFPIYAALQERDMILSIHGEVPGVFVMDAEAAFLDSLTLIRENFPKLRIILEHITTAASVELVSSMDDRVAATITDHHLAITLDDVVGSRIQPHHFCMPVAKRPTDKAALNAIVKQGHPSFFSGTDSAPHMPHDKESACGCAGIFNAPYHMQFLAHHFEEIEALDKLEAFTTQFGADFYEIPRNTEEIHLVRQPQTVPERFGPMVPFRAGHQLNWRLA